MDKINEKSVGFLTVKFYDRYGILTAPTTLSWRIDDYTSGTQILGDTSVPTPTDTVVLKLIASYNAILDSAKAEETHRVTIKANAGTDDAFNSEYLLAVVNLNKIT
jgi:hypothetical protein